VHHVATIDDDAGIVKSQVAHTLAAWVLVKALLDTHAPLAPAAATRDAPGPGAGSSEEDEEEDVLDLRDDEDAMLIDTGFLAKRNLDKEATAAADEALIRVLESGPNSLEAVKEAAGALKALIAGPASTPDTCHVGGGLHGLLDCCICTRMPRQRYLLTGRCYL